MASLASGATTGQWSHLGAQWHPWPRCGPWLVEVPLLHLVVRDIVKLRRANTHCSLAWPAHLLGYLRGEVDEQLGVSPFTGKHSEGAEGCWMLM